MSNLIERYTVTGDATHDPQKFLSLILPSRDQEVWADSAYGSEMTDEALKAMGVTARISSK